MSGRRRESREGRRSNNAFNIESFLYQVKVDEVYDSDDLGSDTEDNFVVPDTEEEEVGSEEQSSSDSEGTLTASDGSSDSEVQSGDDEDSSEVSDGDVPPREQNKSKKRVRNLISSSSDSDSDEVVPAKSAKQGKRLRTLFSDTSESEDSMKPVPSTSKNDVPELIDISGSGDSSDIQQE